MREEKKLGEKSAPQLSPGRIRRIEMKFQFFEFLMWKPKRERMSEKDGKRNKKRNIITSNSERLNHSLFKYFQAIFQPTIQLVFEIKKN